MKNIKSIETIENGFVVTTIDDYEAVDDIVIVEVNFDLIQICKNEKALAKAGCWYDLSKTDRKCLRKTHHEADIFSVMLKNLKEGNSVQAEREILFICEKDTDTCIEAQKYLFETYDEIEDLKNQAFKLECKIGRKKGKMKSIISSLIPDENN